MSSQGLACEHLEVVGRRVTFLPGGIAHHGPTLLVALLHQDIHLGTRTSPAALSDFPTCSFSVMLISSSLFPAKVKSTTAFQMSALGSMAAAVPWPLPGSTAAGGAGCSTLALKVFLTNPQILFFSHLPTPARHLSVRLLLIGPVCPCPLLRIVHRWHLDFESL